MKILVTGASGFIGRNVVNRLMREHELYCVARNGSGLPRHAHVHLLAHDLSKPIRGEGWPSSLDAIIHLAQSRHFRKFPAEARDIFTVNTHSTAQLLDYGRDAKIKTFVFASSGGVCGYQSRPILETDPPKLLNFYLASKYAAECLVNAYAEYFVVANLRYFFVYGEGQRDMFMPSLVGRIVQHAPVIIAGKTGVTMNPVHVSDAVEATASALELQQSETINVAGPDVISVRELAEMIGGLTRQKPVYTQEADKGPLAMVADIEKMKLKLGIVPKVSINEGVKRLVDELAANQPGGGER
jgi:UDP-glucose 4-epimerase